LEEAREQDLVRAPRIQLNQEQMDTLVTTLTKKFPDAKIFEPAADPLK